MNILRLLEVMERGATKFVIGSTIRNAKDKTKTAERIFKEAQKAKRRQGAAFNLDKSGLK